ncbi:alpha/beta hydrolase [Oceanimonas sp. NS1]|nr:alpha/beta hydrolase [Oceanimonas sp. NS1]
MTERQGNLSEQLFPAYSTPPKRPPSPFAAGAMPACRSRPRFVDGADLPGFYRLQKRAFWHWLGHDSIEIEATLARMAAAEGPRSVAGWLDTLAEYKPGNWVYEWSRLGAEAHQAAQAASDQTEARAQFLAAARYFSWPVTPT